MGTKSTTTQSNAYNPQGMGAYNQTQPAWGNQATQFMQNPYGNPQFQLESQMGTRQAQNMGQTNMNQLMQNNTASGMGGGNQSPFMQEMQANQMRANTGLQSQLGFMNPTMMANQRQQMAMGQAAGYRPLQTGGTQTQTTGGLGTWLPQVAGMGMGIAGAAMGMPMGGGGQFAGANSGPMNGGGQNAWLTQNPGYGVQAPDFGGVPSYMGGGYGGGGGMSPWLMQP